MKGVGRGGNPKPKKFKKIQLGTSKNVKKKQKSKGHNRHGHQRLLRAPESKINETPATLCTFKGDLHGTPRIATDRTALHTRSSCRAS